MKYRVAGILIGLVALFGIVPAQSGAASVPEGWPEAFDPGNSRDVRYWAPTVAVGANGYTVWAWWEFPAKFAPSKFMADWSRAKRSARLMVRVRLPGRRGFEPARRFGKIGSTKPKVAIARNGKTVLSWFSKSNRQVFAYRRPNTRWHDFHQIAGRSKPGSVLSIGPDGTAILNGSSPVPGEASKQVLVSVRPPSGRFGPWTRVDQGSETIGNYRATIAARRGRATVVWGAPCPLGVPIEQIDPARYVDLVASVDSEGQTVIDANDPGFIPDSKCPTYYYDLQQDGRGAQYLLTKGSKKLLDVRVASRLAWQPFGPAQTVSAETEQPGGSRLAVAFDGKATVAWESYFPGRDRVGWVRSTTQDAEPFSSREPLVWNLRDRRGFLADLTALPDGTLASAWVKTRPVFKLGFGVIPANRPLARVTYPWPAFEGNAMPYPFEVATSPDGRALAWWALSDKYAEIVGLRWIGFRAR
jgi:hypothetical protein